MRAHLPARWAQDDFACPLVGHGAGSRAIDSGKSGMTHCLICTRSRTTNTDSLPHASIQIPRIWGRDNFRDDDQNVNGWLKVEDDWRHSDRARYESYRGRAVSRGARCLLVLAHIA